MSDRLGCPAWWDVTPVVSGVPGGWLAGQAAPADVPAGLPPPDHLKPDQVTLGAGTGVDRAMTVIEEE